jgi:hypothetical protein
MLQHVYPIENYIFPLNIDTIDTFKACTAGKLVEAGRLKVE